MTNVELFVCSVCTYQKVAPCAVVSSPSPEVMDTPLPTSTLQTWSCQQFCRGSGCKQINNLRYRVIHVLVGEYGPHSLSRFKAEPACAEPSVFQDRLFQAQWLHHIKTFKSVFTALIWRLCYHHQDQHTVSHSQCVSMISWRFLTSVKMSAILGNVGNNDRAVMFPTNTRIF